MNDLTLHDTLSEQKANLTRRIVLSGMFVLVIFVLLGGFRAYNSLRAYDIATGANALADEVHELSREIMVRRGSENATSPALLELLLIDIAKSVHYLRGVQSVALHQLDGSQIWATFGAQEGDLKKQEKQTLKQLMSNPHKQGQAIDVSFMSIDPWVDVFIGEMDALITLVKVNDLDGNVVAFLKLEYDFSEFVEHAFAFSLRVFLFGGLAAFLMFIVLYWSIRSGVKTIELQEYRLNEQITRLSSLLADYKSLQKTMKTANSRSVELREQFLRRIGADLHDGPAQMIGFAVLRLNSVSKDEGVLKFSDEFHAVRDALDQALSEIRGISSGLVLPELEELSFEECLRKVVIFHSVKSDAVVSQYYQDVDVPISLPIKICAYRFVQEGLNNAHNHGQAKKCRLTASIVDNELILSLKDNGIGFRKSKLKDMNGNMGLIGLRGRVEGLGGKFNINSQLGVGTAIKLSLSLVDTD